MASKKIYTFTGFDKVIFNGIELNQVPTTLEDCRWDMIQTFVKDGSLGDHFDIGDTKTIRLSSGEEITMQLVSINDGTGDYGAYYPANTADFVSLNATLSSDNMCDWADTENPYYCSWSNSKARTKLNSTIFNKLPGDLREIIVSKRHQYNRSIANPTANTYSYDYVYCEDNLWLPTLAEMRGGEYGRETHAYNKDYTPLYNKKSFHNIRSTSSIQGYATSSIMVAQNLGFRSGTLTQLANRTTYPVLIGFRIG